MRIPFFVLLALCVALPAFATDVDGRAPTNAGLPSSLSTGQAAPLDTRFGPGSKQRIGAWRELVRTQQRQPSADMLERLNLVNTFFNRIPYVSDQAHWGVEDYWATPTEVLTSNGGDCEDSAIAKYLTLKEMGVPQERLRITYVVSQRLQQAHMVLAYYPTPDAVPLFLDNLEIIIRPATERSDLIPVYHFNDKDVLITRPGQRVVNAGSPRQLRMWHSVLDKLEKETPL